MSKWIIRDWMGNGCNLLGRTEFENYGDARAEIDSFADSIIGEGHEGESEESIEERRNGICEDLYAINIDDNGNELPDEGQYTL